MKTIEVYETLGQSKIDTLEITDKGQLPDAGGAHDSQNNNRVANGKEPLSEELRQATREVLEQEESKIMEEVKKNNLIEQFEKLSITDQVRALKYTQLSESFQTIGLEGGINTVQNELQKFDLPLPTKGDGSYQELPPYSRITKEELRNFVKENWGQYLKAFNPDLTTDVISRKELRAYDKRLMNRLEKLPAEELNNIIQTTSKKIETEIKAPTKEEFKKARQVISRYYDTKELEVLAFNS